MLYQHLISLIDKVRSTHLVLSIIAANIKKKTQSSVKHQTGPNLST